MSPFVSQVSKLSPSSLMMAVNTSVIDTREARRALSVGEAEADRRPPAGIMIGKRSNSSAGEGEGERDKRRSNNGALCCLLAVCMLQASLAISDDRVL